jgi:S-formylglutathione hydrolase FrmB
VLRRIALAGILLCVLAPAARAGVWSRFFATPRALDRLNAKLKGRVVDYTSNHDADRRIYSPALDVKRDLYVYLPPCYDPAKPYPLAFFLHGFAFDEQSFLDFVPDFDRAMASGQFPPVIIAAPDGSIGGRPTLLNAGSFYVNSDAGRFEDYIMDDVWGFMHQNFSIRPERDAHVMIGGSMGGFGAYFLGIKHRDRIGIVAGIFPPLNVRYIDCHGRYFTNFDPNCYAFRTHVSPFAPVGRYAFGLVKVRQRRLIGPLYDGDPHAMERIAQANPAEMLENYDLQPGELQMFVAYVGHDAFNIDAQVDSFLYIARCRGLTVSSVYMPEGRHNTRSAKKLVPSLLAWLGPRIEQYAPK